LTADHKIIIGRFGAPYGVKGWIRVNAFTDPIENILSYQPWLIQQQGEWLALSFTDGKVHSKTIVAKLADYDDRTAVQALTNQDISILRSQIPKADPDEFYWIDLVGLNVIDIHGKNLGIIDHLFETGANDVIVVKGEKEILIPYTDDAIIQVDLKQQKIIVDWEILDS